MTRKEFQAQLRERIGLFNLNYTAYLDNGMVALRYDMEEPNLVSPTVPVSEVDQVLDWAEAHARAAYRAEVAARPQIKLEGYEGPDPKREIPIGYRVFSEGGPFHVRYPDGSQGPVDYTDIADAIADAQFHAWAWPKPTPEDTAMTPTQLRQQLPTGYTATFQDGSAFIHTPNGYRSQPFNPWSGALAWAQQHDKETYADAAARLPAGFGISSFDLELGGYRLLHPKAILPQHFITRGLAADRAVELATLLDQIPEGYRVVGKITGGLTTWTAAGPDKADVSTHASLEGAISVAVQHAMSLGSAMVAHTRQAIRDNLNSLSIPEWATQDDLLQQCRFHAPFGFTLERQGDFHFRILGPDGVYIAHNLANPEEALTQAKQMDARRTEHAIYCPPGYMARNLSDDPSDPEGTWVIFRQGQSQRVFNATYAQRDWAMGAARDHALQQEKAAVVDASHFEQTGTITVQGRRTLEGGRTIPEGWGILQSKRALDAGTEDGWNITQPGHAGMVKVIDRDEPREWPTPEAALDFILAQPDTVQDIPQSAHEAVADQVLPEGYSIRMRPPFGSHPVQFRVLYPGGGRSSLFKHATAAARHARDHWAALTVRDETRMPPGYGWTYDDLDGMPSICKVVTYPDGENSEAFDERTALGGLYRHAWDHFENKLPPTPEDTAMTHPANEGPALREIEKMIRLLENGEWADTFPVHAQGQRLNAVINALVAKVNQTQAEVDRLTTEEPHNWAKATYELDALRDCANDPEKLAEVDVTTPVAAPWKALLIGMQQFADRSADAAVNSRDSSQAAFDELIALRDLFAKSDLAGLEAYDTQFAIGAAWQDAAVHALRVMQLPNPELPPAFKSAAVELAMAVLDTTGDRTPYAYRVIRLAAGTPAPEHKL